MNTESCITCQFLNRHNSFCTLRNILMNDYENCLNYEQRAFTTPTQGVESCLTCKEYKITSAFCVLQQMQKPMTWKCELYKAKFVMVPITPDTSKFVSILASGCSTYDHGTNLYNRCKDHLEAIKADDSKIKGVRIVFTKNDKPTTPFWRSLIEKLYHKYEQSFLMDKVCMKGLLLRSLSEAKEMRNVIYNEQKRKSHA